MAKITYVGPHSDGVDVPLPDGRIMRVQHGDDLETSDDHAALLLDQAANWQPAKLVEKKKEA